MAIDEKKDKKRVNAELSGIKQVFGNLFFEELVSNEVDFDVRQRINQQEANKILRDDQVAAAMMQRISSVVGNDYKVVAGAKDKESLKAADFIAEQLQHIDWNSVTAAMMMAIFYGFKPAENLFSSDGRFIYLDEVKPRNPDYFGFDADENLVFIGLNGTTEGKKAKPPYFWYSVYGRTSSDELYGRGIVSALYYPVLFKHAGVQSWLDFLDGAAHPKMIGKLADFASDDEKEALLEVIKSINGYGGAVLNNDEDIGVIESKRDGKEFDNFTDFCDKAISKIILGQSLTIEDGTSRSFGKTLLEIRQERAKRDNAIVENPFNKHIVKFLVESNFPKAKMPHVRRDLEIKEDIESRSRADVRIFSMGAKPTQDYIDNTYGHGWVIPDYSQQEQQKDGRVNTLTGMIMKEDSNPVKRAQTDVTTDLSANTIDYQEEVDAVADAAVDEIDSAMDAVVNNVLEFIEQNGIDKTIEKLNDAIPDKDFTEIADIIENAGMIAAGIGMADND